jgi:hypothetical protein
MYLGVVSGYGLALVISYLGSRKYRSIFWDFMHDLRNGRPIEERTRFCFIIGFVVLLGIFLIFSMFANDDILRWDVLATVAIPCLFLCPLWISGLDRLHKFYSELQARIGGNILRLQQTTQQQMVDLITQSDSRKSLKKNLRNALESNQQLFDFLEKFFPKDDKGPGPTSPPGGGN